MADETGKKFDVGKPQMATILGQFRIPLQAVCRPGEFGIGKYGLCNWRQVDGGRERYQNALMRHFLAHLDGELYDPETNILHMAHVGWNALAILYFMIVGEKITEVCKT